MTDELLPKLEEKNPRLKACIHERDFRVGVTVTENIVECIDRSRRFLLVLSEGFLASQWCQFELHVAQHQLAEQGSQAILAVVRGELVSKPSPSLAYLLRSRTYLQWPAAQQRQTQFWLKLKQSLLIYKPLQQKEIAPQFNVNHKPCCDLYIKLFR